MPPIFAGWAAVAAALGLGFWVWKLASFPSRPVSEQRAHFDIGQPTELPLLWLCLGLTFFPLLPFSIHALGKLWAALFPQSAGIGNTPAWISAALFGVGAAAWPFLLGGFQNNDSAKILRKTLSEIVLRALACGVILTYLTRNTVTVPGSDPAATIWTAGEFLKTGFDYSALHPFQRVYPDAWITWVAQTSQTFGLPPLETTLELSRALVAFGLAGAALFLRLFDPGASRAKRLAFSLFFLFGLFTPTRRWSGPGQLAFVSAWCLAIPPSLLLFRTLVLGARGARMPLREALRSGFGPPLTASISVPAAASLLGVSVAGTILHHYAFATWFAVLGGAYLILVLTRRWWQDPLSATERGSGTEPASNDRFAELKTVVWALGVCLLCALPKLVVLTGLKDAWKRDPETQLPPVGSLREFFEGTVTESVHQLVLQFTHSDLRWLFLLALGLLAWNRLRAPSPERLRLSPQARVLGLLTLLLALAGSGLFERWAVPGVSSHYARRLWSLLTPLLVAWAASAPLRLLAPGLRLAALLAIAVAGVRAAALSGREIHSSRSPISEADLRFARWAQSHSATLPAGLWVSKNSISINPIGGAFFTNSAPSDLLPYWTGREILLSFVPTRTRYRTDAADRKFYLSYLSEGASWNRELLRRLLCQGIRLLYARQNFDGLFSAAAMEDAIRSLPPESAAPGLRTLFDSAQDAPASGAGPRVLAAEVIGTISRQAECPAAQAAGI